ncbi:hypothetical protein H9Y04_27970 [Streptomyces sp. TRM66268-LWL]|uniref:Uncharacterized protein n=1 Tax=Streptomyces polyasparticus TaxID=2767826 RepID=A0ABR7SNE8_9ACTN|nr:hypothetical protein [Streptomyces polyasparticus]MBC9716379.1 hypothetical protein [Streptomyces polyasparticus]
MQKHTTARAVIGAVLAGSVVLGAAGGSYAAVAQAPVRAAVPAASVAAYEDMLRAYAATAESLVADVEQGTVDADAYRAAFDRALTAPAPEDVPQLEAAMAGLSVQASALVDAIEKKDTDKVLASISLVNTAVANIVSALSLDAAIKLVAKPLDPSSIKLPTGTKLPEFKIPFFG